MITNDAMLKRIHKRNVLLFALLSLVMIILIWVCVLVAFGSEVFTQSLIRTALIDSFIDICIVLLCTFLFHKMNKKWRAEANAAVNEPTLDPSKAIDSFTIKGAVLFIIQSALICSFTIFTAYLSGAIAGLVVFGLIALTSIIGIDLGLILFRSLKRAFFDLSSDFPKISNLSLSHRLAIASIIWVISALSVIAAVTFRIFMENIKEDFYFTVNEESSYHVNYLNSLVAVINSTCTSYGLSAPVRSMETERLRTFLRNVSRNKNYHIEMVMAAGENGMGYSSINTSDYIGDQDYFKTPMATGNMFISSVHKSLATGNDVFTVSYPVKAANGSVMGIIGVTVNKVHLDNIIKINNDLPTAVASIVLSDGTIWYSTNSALAGLKIGESPAYTSNGSDNLNLDRLLNSPDGEIFSFTQDGREMIGCRMTNAITGLATVLTMEKKTIMRASDYVIILLLAVAMLCNAATIIPILLITRSAIKNISTPIRQTTQKLIGGSLEMEINKFTADEMGLFLYNFVEYTNKMRNIVTKIADTTLTLRSASKEFEAASRSLSEGTQSRAASVEEATAAIEEVAASVERINETATTQKETTGDNLSTVDSLKNGIGDVLNSTIEALNIAKRTSEEAKTGNKLMHNTITGMNNIDTSTKKIAEMIRLISDISDQVSLLAINASIESARAGEQGKGFAVVAEEISKLADETATTAKNINDLVKASLKEVAAGLKYADETNAAFDTITADIGRTEKLINQITEASKVQFATSEKVFGNMQRQAERAETISVASNEQMITNQEMTKTIEQINQGTLSEAARAEEIASSAAEIDAQAAVLEEEISFFKM